MKYLLFVLLAGCHTFGEVEPFEKNDPNLPDAQTDEGNNGTTNNGTTNNGTNNNGTTNNSTNNNVVANPSFPNWPSCPGPFEVTQVTRGQDIDAQANGAFSTAWLVNNPIAWLAWTYNNQLKTATTNPTEVEAIGPDFNWDGGEVWSVKLRSMGDKIGHIILGARSDGKLTFQRGLDLEPPIVPAAPLASDANVEVDIAGGVNPLTNKVEAPMRWLVVESNIMNVYDLTVRQNKLDETGLRGLVTSSGALVALNRDSGPVMFDVVNGQPVAIPDSIEDLLYLGSDGSEAHYLARRTAPGPIITRLVYENGLMEVGMPIPSLEPPANSTNVIWFGVPGGFVQAWSLGTEVGWRLFRFDPLGAFTQVREVKASSATSAGEKIVHMSGHFTGTGCDGRLVLHVNIGVDDQMPQTLTTLNWDVQNLHTMP